MTQSTFRPSSFLATKGGMVEPTFRAFRDWDLSISKEENIQRIRESNSVGGPSSGWLKDFGKLISRRFDVEGRDESLVRAAITGWNIEAWTPLLLWHMGLSDPLLNVFLSEWLITQKEEGVVLLRSVAAKEFLKSYLKDALDPDQPMWSDSNLNSSANGLLRTAVEFHLLEGRNTKRFAAYRLPESSFLYLLYALMERENSTRNVIHAADWRLFLLHPQDIEEELLRLHQFGRLRFERAGSFLELTLPCRDADEFIRSRAG